MSEPKYVTFPVAKLLKEKGFDIPCIYFWFEKGNISKPSRKQFQIPFNWNNFESGMRMSAPLQSDVVDWLLEKHGIWIQCVIYRRNPNDYICGVYFNKLDSYLTIPFTSPQEAYEKAFEYILTNLI